MAKRRKRKNDRIDPTRLAPGIASGLTQGIPKEEVLRDIHPVSQKPSGVEMARVVSGNIPVLGTRVNAPRFVASLNTGAVVNMGDGRKLIDVNVAMNDENRRAILAGNMCLRCLEPQPVAFPVRCDLCGYPRTA